MRILALSMLFFGLFISNLFAQPTTPAEWKNYYTESEKVKNNLMRKNESLIEDVLFYSKKAREALEATEAKDKKNQEEEEKKAKVKLGVAFNLFYGQLLQKVVENFHAKGSFTYPVNVSSLADGVYLCQLKADDISIVKRFVVRK